MKRQIFEWNADSGCTAVVTTPDGVDSRFLTSYMDISSLRETLTLERVVNPKRPPKPVLDFVATGVSQPQVLSEHALAGLEPFLRPNGVLTRVLIQGDERDFFAFTPKRVLDVLDEARSAIKPTSYGRYLSRAAFRPYDFDDHDVFVLKGFENLGIFVTDAFVRAVEAADLRGARFDPQIMSRDAA